MIEYLPSILKKKKIEELPPGMTIIENNNPICINLPVRCVYIGGIGNHYKMAILFQAIKKSTKIEGYFSFRKDEWEKEKKFYKAEDIKNISIFHYDNESVAILYAQCHIGLIFVEPSAYRKFAIPYKLFEYLSYGKPIIATEGTAAGDFVKRWNVGWVIPYEKDMLVTLFALLSTNLEKIEECARNIEMIRKTNTWCSRTLKVKDDLSQI
jgi:glycosyltransferase involved in cell wall biosynthesis